MLGERGQKHHVIGVTELIKTLQKKQLQCWGTEQWVPEVKRYKGEYGGAV
jgi:hypothetical protein